MCLKKKKIFKADNDGRDLCYGAIEMALAMCMPFHIVRNDRMTDKNAYTTNSYV